MMSLASYFLQLEGILLFLIIPTVYGDCAYDGKTFKAYTVVYKTYDAANDWCFVGLCAHNGNIWKLVDLNCRRRSSTGNTIDSGKMTSTAATTTTPTATTPGTGLFSLQLKYKHNLLSNIKAVFRNTSLTRLTEN